MVQSVDGKTLAGMLIHASACLNAEKQKINELNVFPVPDGDTGTNMSMSASAAKRELTRVPDGAPVSQVADTCAGALLRGALVCPECGRRFLPDGEGLREVE